MIDKKPMAENRGFDRSKKTYTTRTGEPVALTDQEYRLAVVFDDILNKHLFVNTRDLKKVLESPLKIVMQHQRREDELA